MRLIIFVLATLIVGHPAAAQDWQEYSYPDDSFAVMFPAAPKVERITYQVADGRFVPARVYSLVRDKSDLKVIVADLDNTDLTENVVLDYAIKRLSSTGDVSFDYPHRIYSVYGRQIGIDSKDGGRTRAAMFDIYGRLYQIEAKVLPGGSDIDLIRFQQSLVFDRDVSNRTPEQIRAFIEACANSPTRPLFPPGGLDDPRCVQQ